MLKRSCECKKLIYLCFIILKNITMRTAKVIANGEVKYFYQNGNETQPQMHQRIMHEIVQKFGICSINIQWFFN